MTALNLASIAAIIASYGRGVVFRAPVWDPAGGPLTMSQLGITEGDIVATPNPATAGMTFGELSGPAMHEMDYLGENPTLEIPMYLADPTLLALISPTGSASAGRERRGSVVEHTLAVFPEALFLDANASGQTVAFDGVGAWTFNGSALTPQQQQYLDSSLWLWRGAFTRPPRRFRGGAGDDKKNLETATFQVLHHAGMPNGHHLYTTGDPFTQTIPIDLNGGS